MPVGVLRGDMSYMEAKRQALAPTRLPSRAGIQAEVVPIIKDRYVTHHQNLSGAAYGIV